MHAPAMQECVISTFKTLHADGEDLVSPTENDSELSGQAVVAPRTEKFANGQVCQTDGSDGVTE